MLTRRLTPRAARLVADLRSVLRDRDRTPARAARALERHLGRPDLLLPYQCEPDPDSYRQHLLHVEDDGSFSVVALVWLPGQHTPVHDHVSWCVVGTHRGAEEETAFRLDGDHLTPVRTAVTPQGTATFLTPPGDIHLVRNSTDELVISIHVYGADIAVLGSSVRRLYDLPVRTLSL